MPSILCIPQRKHCLVLNPHLVAHLHLLRICSSKHSQCYFPNFLNWMGFSKFLDSILRQATECSQLFVHQVPFPFSPRFAWWPVFHPHRGETLFFGGTTTDWAPLGAPRKHNNDVCGEKSLCRRRLVPNYMIGHSKKTGYALRIPYMDTKMPHGLGNNDEFLVNPPVKCVKCVKCQSSPAILNSDLRLRPY